MGLTLSAISRGFLLQLLDEVLEIRSVAKRVKVSVSLKSFHAETTGLQGAAQRCNRSITVKPAANAIALAQFQGSSPAIRCLIFDTKQRNATRDVAR